MQQKPNYRVYPSLLKTYFDYVNFESLWTNLYKSEDNPKVSLDEFHALQERRLLDTLNRVEGEPSEAADRGTVLNEAVDCILERRKPVAGITLRSVLGPSGELQSVLGAMHGFRFNYEAGLVFGLADYFRGSTCQHLCEAVMNTLHGPVLLYGYADYIRRDVVHDLKTTGSYKYGKYEDGFQKDLYPWCLIESGEVDSVSGFEYTVVELSGGTPKNPLISGTMYLEWYDYDHRRAGDRLREATESLIWWVEAHRNLIHNERIFNK